MAGFVVQLATVTEECDVDPLSRSSPNMEVCLKESVPEVSPETPYQSHLSLTSPTLNTDQFLITEVQYLADEGDGSLMSEMGAGDSPEGGHNDLDEKTLATTMNSLVVAKGDFMKATVDLGAGDALDFDFDFFNGSSDENRNSDSEDEENDLEEELSSGKSEYLDLCQEMGFHPVSAFIRDMKHSHISLPYFGLGQGAIKPITIILRNSLTLEKLDLTENQIDEEGAQFIGKLLEENDFITDINLSNNQIGSNGIASLAKMLCQNTGLRRLNLSGNDLQDEIIEPLMAALERNKYLEEINLSRNKFTEKGGLVLGPALSANDSLQILDLSWNSIRLKGGVAIAKGLKENVRLKVCRLAFNGLGEEGGRAMAETLSQNSVLRELDLSGNRISDNCLRDLAKALLVNETIQILKLGKNPIMTSGAISLITAINSNENSAITFLDLTDIAVEYEFLRIITDIKGKRKDFQVTYGYVLRSGNTKEDYGKDALDFDPNGDCSSHPLVILQENVVIRDQKLMDALKKCDKQGKYCLSLENFIAVIKELKIAANTTKLIETLHRIANQGSGKIYFGDATVKQ